MCKQYQSNIKHIGLVSVICWSIFVLFVMMSMAVMMTGCRSVKSVESTMENHRVSQLVDRMDSLVHTTATWQQDIYQRQSSLVDSFRQKERNDTSYSVVINENGDTVKERLVIIREVEKNHNSEKSETEVWMQKFREVDSLLRVSLDKQAVTDSLLKERNKETVVEKKPSLWQNIGFTLKAFGFTVIIVILFFSLNKVRKWLRGKHM